MRVRRSAADTSPRSRLPRRLRRRLLLALAMVAVAGCGQPDDRTELVVQRFFGACEADYGTVTDVAAADGECGIITAIVNRFEAEHPDIRVVENVVYWPGYDQLTAQLAANDAPDVVTMHGSVISDYQARGLLEPLGPALAGSAVDLDDLTAAARRAVTIDGELWGLPMDTWAPLWHVNMNLFRAAELVGGDGRPILPGSVAELLEQAEQFTERTGKPYLVQSSANEYASFTRNFYTFVMQQGGTLYDVAGPGVAGTGEAAAGTTPRATLQTPEAAQTLELFKTIRERGLTTRNLDYSAAVSAFLKGDGGVFLVGTWMVGAFDAAARRPNSALHDGYAVAPYPQLYQHDVTYADGHNWVMPKNDRRTPAERAAAIRFLEFVAAHNFEWSRTGHLPVFRSIVASGDWQALPHRAALAELSRTAVPLPKQVLRQFPIETIVGQEAGAAINGIKPIPDALADMERRVNEVLAHL